MMTPMIANVVLAFSIPYMSLIPLGLGVLIVETIIFKLYQRGRSSHLRAALLVAAANAVSFLVGLLIAGFMPTGLEPNGRISQNYILLAHLAFLWAWFLSCVIEGVVIWSMSRRAKLDRLVGCVVMMNTVSYILLWLVFNSMLD